MIAGSAGTAGDEAEETLNAGLLEGGVKKMACRHGVEAE